MNKGGENINENTSRSIGTAGLRILNSIYEGVLISDSEGKVVYSNPGFAKTALLSAEDIEGKNLITDQIFRPLQPLLGYFEQAKNTSQPVKFNCVRLCEDGRERFVSGKFEACNYNSDSIYICVLRDVSTEKRASEALSKLSGKIDEIAEKRSEKLAKTEREKEAILNAMTENVAFQDTDHNLLWVNTAAAESIGKKPDDLIGKKCYALWQERTEPCDNCPVTKAFEKGEPVEGTFSTPDGSLWQIKGYPVKDDDGEIFGAIELGTDITEKARVERELEKQRLEYRNLIEQAPVGIFHTTIDGKVLMANPVMVKVLGYESELDFKEHVNASSLEDVLFLYRDRRKELVQKVLSTGGWSIHEIEYRKKDGSPLTAEVTIRAVFDDQAKVEYFEGFAQDITQRKLVEEIRQQSDKKFRMLYKYSPLGYQSLDEQGNFIEVNPAWEKITGYDRDEVVGSCFADILTEEHRKLFPERFSLFKKQGYIRQIRYEIITKSGEIKPVEFDGNIERDEDGNFICTHCMMQDISQRLIEQSQKEMFNSVLQEKNKELESIIHIASHDLRTPLVNVKGFSRELKYSCDRVKELLEDVIINGDKADELHEILQNEVPESLGFIINSAEKMSAILDGLLKLARLGKSALTFEDIDMNELVCEIRDSMEYTIHNLDVKVEIEDLPPCRAEREQIIQIFSNFLSNALKYLDEDRKGHIKITGEKIPGYTKYCVEDNGIGIEQDNLDKIFGIFYRISSEGKQPGDGLGLTIVKRIVEMHKGAVWAESEYGKGSKFSFTIADNINGVNGLNGIEAKNGQ